MGTRLLEDIDCPLSICVLILDPKPEFKQLDIVMSNSKLPMNSTGFLSLLTLHFRDGCIYDKMSQIAKIA